MVQLYVTLIQAGRKTLEEIPEKYKTAVEAALEA